jgi:SAM-dependent methyltransferase
MGRARKDEEMNIKDDCPLSFSGFPALEDISHPSVHELLVLLNAEQTDFSRREAEFRSAEYRWPKRPLHTWSRIWEYPYIYHHLKKVNATRTNPQLMKVVDYGSGVTFFPFAVSKLGCEVTCLDVDPICLLDIPAAAAIVEHAPGSVRAVTPIGGSCPVDSSSQDVVYCVSVLEHIPDKVAAIDDMHRILRPGGHLLLTFDIDLRGDSELGVSDFNSLLSELAGKFDLVAPIRPVHPLSILTSANSMYPYKHSRPQGWARQALRSVTRRGLFANRLSTPLYLTVFCAVYRKQHAET